MVRGLEIFKEHFRDFTDFYVLIGGTASSVAFDDAGIDFRVTKDLDIVLIIEVFDKNFAVRFWDFIKKGRYENKQKSTGRHVFYRFNTPEDTAYPQMIELFSRKPDLLTDISEESELTPIPVDEEISSLSAILLDTSYYQFIFDHVMLIDGLSIVGPEILIPLKAKAWLDLTERKRIGERVDSRNIKKHRNDIFRLFILLSAETKIDLPGDIKSDMSEYLKLISLEPVLGLKDLGIRSLSMTDVLTALSSIYL